MTPAGEPRDRAAARLRSGRGVTVDGVLFDMDGTLVDSLGAVEESWRLWARELGLPTPSGAFHGRPASEVVRAMGVAPADRTAALALLEDIEAREGQAVAPMPGALALLAAVPPRRWGIVTSATRRVAEVRLRAAGIRAPDVFVTGDDVAEGKPHPEAFVRGIRGLGLGEGAVVLAVEDSPAGLRSATAAGCLTVGVAATAEAVRAVDALADGVADGVHLLDLSVAGETLVARLLSR